MLKTLDKKELKEIIQSGNINLLIGSGCSKPYLSTLTDIEKRMDDDEAREGAQKDYYRIIRQSKSVIDETREGDAAQKDKLLSVRKNYEDFVKFWTEAMFSRYLSIVNKQVNVFTTNFDMFYEDACERQNVPYNDGFAGQLRPIFNAANFNKIQKYKSLQFDNTSDIPVFNIVKLHGSLSWKTVDGDILHSDGSHISDDLDSKEGEEFSSAYNSQLSVINPNIGKHLSTVLNRTYAAMLRKFALELEKENSVLFIIGNSLADDHIRDLLYGVMETNPTLVVVYISYSPYKEAPTEKDKEESVNLYNLVEDEARRPNFYIVADMDGNNMPFDKTTDFLKTILPRIRPEPIEKELMSDENADN